MNNKIHVEFIRTAPNYRNVMNYFIISCRLIQEFQGKNTEVIELPLSSSSSVVSIPVKTLLSLLMTQAKAETIS